MMEIRHKGPDPNADQTVEQFMEVLAERITQLATLCQSPKESLNEINFVEYQKFREMMSECLSFLIIIERRLEQSDTPKAEELADQFDELTAAVWAILLEGSLGYLKQICAKELLPIGTKFIFIQELKTLYDAEKTIKQGKFSKHLKEHILDQRGKAERILEEIIDRAPQLLKLGI